MRKSTGSGVEWAECSLIIGTGYRVQDLAWSSIAQSICQRAFSLLRFGVWGPGFESCIQQRNLSISLACARASELTTAKMYVSMYICMCMSLCVCVWDIFTDFACHEQPYFTKHYCIKMVCEAFRPPQLPVKLHIKSVFFLGIGIPVIKTNGHSLI